VRTFYARIRADEVLGPIFERTIGADWEPHLHKMFDFWSSVMLTSGRYKGQPMLAHMRLKTVRPEHFDRWLTLFPTDAGRSLYAGGRRRLHDARAAHRRQSAHGHVLRSGRRRSRPSPRLIRSPVRVTTFPVAARRLCDNPATFSRDFSFAD